MLTPTARVVRVYSTSDKWGDAERLDPIGGPLQADGFPTASGRLTVWFGAVPQWLIEVRRRRLAIGRVMLQTSFKADLAEADSEVLIERELAAVAHEFNDAWYLTLAIGVGAIEVPASPALSNWQWLDFFEARKVAHQLIQKHESDLDVVAAYLSAILGPSFVERVAVEGNVVFSSPGYDDLSVPEFSGSGAATITRGLSGFPAERLRKRIDAIAAAKPADHRWIARVAHWSLQAHLTDDEWKRFLWSFLALEVLTHKLAAQHYGSIIERLQLHEESAVVGAGVALQALMPSDIRRLSLASEFAVAALALSPTTADADVADFVTAKRARDRLAHGDIRRAAELPTAMTVGLLDRYIRIAIERQLGDEPADEEVPR